MKIYSPVSPQNVASPLCSIAEAQLGRASSATKRGGPAKQFGGGCLKNMFYVYVLQSEKNNKKYIGLTSKDVFVRLNEHNHGTNQWTRNNRPFNLIYCEQYADEAFARKREKFLKSGNGREVLKKKLYSPVAQLGRASGCQKAASSGNAS